MPKFKEYVSKPITVKACQWKGFKDGPHDLGVVPIGPERPGVGIYRGNDITLGDFVVDSGGEAPTIVSREIFSETFKLAGSLEKEAPPDKKNKKDKNKGK